MQSLQAEAHAQLLKKGHYRDYLKTAPWRFRIPDHKNRPELLEKAKINAVRLVSEHFKFLKSFQFVRKKETHSGRKMRDEGLRSASLVAQMVMHLTDMETNTIGWWDATTGEFVSPSLKVMHRMLNRGIECEEHRVEWSCFKNIMRRFKKAGYLSYKQTRYVAEEHEDPKDNIVKNDIALKRVTYQFFFELGIKKKEIEKAREASKLRNTLIRQDAGVHLSVGDIFNQYQGPVRRFFEDIKRKKRKQRQEKEKAKADKLAQLRQEEREEASRQYYDRVHHLSDKIGRSLTRDEILTYLGPAPENLRKQSQKATADPSPPDPIPEPIPDWLDA